ncbi:MAG: hypothetical protein IPG94_22270 [Kineosporiaceae bacterium]|nr:hypothetical protein [Kineosporiaceae bacterium]
MQREMDEPRRGRAAAARRALMGLAEAYLARVVPPELEPLLHTSEGRRALTQDEPLLFALLYLTRHLKSPDTGGQITLSQVHLDWCRQAQWMTRPSAPAEQRDAYIAPRSMGKSTWWFLALPMWAAAHGHSSFVAAMSDSAAQAETHLSTFKHELDTNELLRADYPELCRALSRPRGSTVADNRAMLITAAGFVFAARGIDSSNLGLKVGDKRPDLIILDDVEPDESSYSAAQALKRLGTIRDAVLPLSVYARVVLVGTVTMPGSIVHQLVKAARGEPDLPAWIAEEGFRAHYYAPITEAGESVWPEKWPLELPGVDPAYPDVQEKLPQRPDGRRWGLLVRVRFQVRRAGLPDLGGGAEHRPGRDHQQGLRPHRPGHRRLRAGRQAGGGVRRGGGGADR